MEVDEIASEVTILMLNDDCLCNIFEYLNLREVFAMETAYSRFHTAAQMIYRRQRVLDFDEIVRKEEVLSLIELKDFCKRVGPYIHTLRASKESFKMSGRMVPRSIFMYCNNLHNITLNGFSFPNQRIIASLSKLCKSAKKLELLWGFHIRDDNIEPALKMSSQLQSLNLCGNMKITGECFRHLTNLTELNVSHCNKINPDFFVEFCEANPQLQSLNISECGFIDQRCLQTVSRTLMNLESLTINEQYRKLPADVYIAVADLPKITRVKVMRDWSSKGNSMLDIFITRLSTHNRLEHLEIRFTQLHRSLKRAIGLFTKLKVLKLWDFVLEELSCSDTLEVIEIDHISYFYRNEVCAFIKKFKNLRQFIINHYLRFCELFIMVINDQCNFDDRPQILEIIINGSNILNEWKDDKFGSRMIEDELRGKAKLICDGKILV